jgi:DNA repair exonuclease SbcCD ATPase subunit
MLANSKVEGAEMRSLYAKYKCYCDDQTKEKEELIAELTKEIGVLESKIEALQASTGILSQNVAALTASMSENEQARSEADTIRTQENDAFLAKEADLQAAITQLTGALETLSEIGADQTLASGADNAQYMANFSLASLRDNVKEALVAASAFTSKKQDQVVQAFLQSKGPFTSTYTAQSGEVVGVLKDMKATFETNLADAQRSETEAANAHTSYMSEMEAAYSVMETQLETDNAEMSSNDADLSTKQVELTNANAEKSEAESFLASLTDMCSAKAKEFEERKVFRANEEAAIAQAVAILNSDAAFETFGATAAATSGSVPPTTTAAAAESTTPLEELARPAFLQLRAVHRHNQLPASADARRLEAKNMLRKVAGKKGSMILNKIVALLESGNPFTTVLEQIEKMVALIADEEKADDDKFAWCESERTTNDEQLTQKTAEIDTLNGQIDALTSAISDPVSGLEVSISDTETALQTNHDSQASETSTRKEENADYRKRVDNLVEAESLLEKAITILKAYYARILGNAAAAALLQSNSTQPAPPSTWEGAYTGQSSDGNSAVQMLEFILTNTHTEETNAHQDENSAQHAFEDSMQALKDEAALLADSLASLKLELATKQKELLGKKEDLAATEKDKASIEEYLASIKPGCDFITTHLTARKNNRVEESNALENAVSLIRGTPAYQEAVAMEHNETLGGCLGICAGREDHVECRACLTSVSVPGYCAGHPDTPGC